MGKTLLSPSAEILGQSEAIYYDTLHGLLDEGCPTQNELAEMSVQAGVLTEEESERETQLTASLDYNLERFKDNESVGSLEEAKKIAVDILRYRNRLAGLRKKMLPIYLRTAEPKAEKARFLFLVSECFVDEETGEKSIDVASSAIRVLQHPYFTQAVKETVEGYLSENPERVFLLGLGYFLHRHKTTRLDVDNTIPLDHPILGYAVSKKLFTNKPCHGTREESYLSFMVDTKKLAFFRPSFEIFQMASDISLEYHCNNQDMLFKWSINMEDKLRKRRKKKAELVQRIKEDQEWLLEPDVIEDDRRIISESIELDIKELRRVERLLGNVPPARDSLVYEKMLQFVSSQCVIDIQTGERVFLSHADFAKRLGQHDPCAVKSLKMAARIFPPFYENRPGEYPPIPILEKGVRYHGFYD